LLNQTEQLRERVAAATDAKKKSRLGQFLTPASIARFMASLFRPATGLHCRLLDPGAGIGSLSVAFLERCRAGELCFDGIQVDAFEVDESIAHHLRQTLDESMASPGVSARVVVDDFIAAAVRSLSGDLFSDPLRPYSHVIMNPPYRKVRNDSPHRVALRQVGIETVNLYSAFVALSLALLAPHGQLVAILPRSFCNGPYYRPFREFLLARAAIQRIHLFGRRDRAFRSDSVLQENLVILMERDGVQSDVDISFSTDDSFADVVSHTCPFEEVVRAADGDRFIHIPSAEKGGGSGLPSFARFSLEDIDIQVSTGPVVDFRLREYLQRMPVGDSAPLLYPGHFAGSSIAWPLPGFRKANAIACNSVTDKWLYPNGFYTVVRRLSAKEERRRIMASVVDPQCFLGAPRIGFENHLNVFHCHKGGLPEALAYGLSSYLNATAVDVCFRRFNGHTQVNATDLRALTYPGRQALQALGEWAMGQPELTQELIDDQLERMAV